MLGIQRSRRSCGPAAKSVRASRWAMAIGKERAGGLAPVVEDEERAADAVQMIGAAAPRPAGLHARLRGIRPFAQRMDQPVARKRRCAEKRHVTRLPRSDRARARLRGSPSAAPPERQSHAHRRRDRRPPPRCRRRLRRPSRAQSPPSRPARRCAGQSPLVRSFGCREPTTLMHGSSSSDGSPRRKHQRRTIPSSAKRRRIARRDACEREDAPPLRRGEIGMERCLPRADLRCAPPPPAHNPDGSDPSPSGRAADLPRRVRRARPLRQCAELRIAQRAAGFIAQGAAQQQHPLLRRSQRRNRRARPAPAAFSARPRPSVPSSKNTTFPRKGGNSSSPQPPAPAAGRGCRRLRLAPPPPVRPRRWM